MIHKYVLAVIASWLIASLIKGLISKESILNGFSNGGMPSSHVSTLSTITTLLFLDGYVGRLGFELFFLSLVLTTIVGIDAVRTRKTLERYGRKLNEMLDDDSVRIVEGHTTKQVWAGAILGVVVGYLAFLL